MLCCFHPVLLWCLYIGLSMPSEKKKSFWQWIKALALKLWLAQRKQSGRTSSAFNGCKPQWGQFGSAEEWIPSTFKCHFCLFEQPRCIRGQDLRQTFLLRRVAICSTWPALASGAGRYLLGGWHLGLTITEWEVKQRPKAFISPPHSSRSLEQGL